MPDLLDLADQVVLVLFAAPLDLVGIAAEPLLQLVGVPAVVWLHNVVVPVILDQVLKVLTVGGGGVWDVVVRQPPLELGLMPLVVDYERRTRQTRLYMYQLCPMQMGGIMPKVP